ncbi:hypothetical protein RND81_13G180900 [Saponaria officinalis]|uniref:Import inner membrane translocase subunit n=1 Tax=Saponaria officinalis TaxID=3572 RepID=A0AAW1H2S5_SAPOF
MSNPSQRIIKGLLKLHFNVSQTLIPKPYVHSVRGFSTLLSNSAGHLNVGFQSSISKPMFSNGVLSTKFGSLKSHTGVLCRNYSVGNVKTNGLSAKNSGFEKLAFNPLKLRQFSTKLPNFGTKLSGAKLNSNVAKKVVREPLSVVSKTFSRYKEAIGLQIEGFWKRNILLIVGAGGVIVCIMLWRIMFGIANTFVGLSEGMAKYGFLALSSAIVAFTVLYLRSKYNVNPDKVYRMAMRELNTDARSLEVMGAPLAGTDLRAYVMSGGGLTMTKFKPRLRSKSCFIIFPVRGSERKGLVSVHVKKKKGKYDVKLLAVDVPMASGPDQRIFLVGGEDEYRIGGGLIAELRDPVIHAMAATKELEEKDDIEAEEDEVRELQEAERKHQEEVAKLQSQKST